ncbi:MAG: rsbV5 [Actinomycetia bacterium]|nr:rsbV5 [Actinomycetes bacterium]
MNDRAAQIKPVIVVLPAEIDVTNSDGVYQQLLAALASGVGTVIADMTSTSFCDSSGVHAIVRAHERATAQDMVLRLAVSPTGSVHRVLQLTGAVLVMPVHSSVQEAMDPT